MPYNFFGYSALALDHYDHPRNVGEFEEPDAVATVANPACGDTLKLSLRIAGDRVEEARFRASGCVGIIAASSAATEMIRGLTIGEASACTSRMIDESLGGLPKAKIHGASLAEAAIRQALRGRAEERRS